VEIPGWRAALFKGWKIAVGSITLQGALLVAFIIHDPLDDREREGESRSEGRAGPYFSKN